VDTLAALSSGAYVLAEDHLYAVEACHEYLETLRPGGLLSVGALDSHPQGGGARHAPRFCSISCEALREWGVVRPHGHVAVMGEDLGSAQFEVLTKLEPFTETEIHARERFVDGEGFEAWPLLRRWAFLGYFAALGAGFSFAEISFVQRFIEFLGYPTYALTVVLFSFLAAGYLSGWLPARPRRVLSVLVGALAVLVGSICWPCPRSCSG